MHGSEQSAVERVATPATPYRPDIDGLRAFAVLAVVLFHVGLAPVSGGYIGVDVFFVISGYLITRLIVNEFAASGRIAFGAFYVRRLRRLFPAMLTTTIASLIAAFILFSPEQLATFGASAIAAVFSVSNIYFWQQADYFDISAHSKPLLHTWSLSVEEQFYMVLPATLYLLMRSFGRAGWPLAMLIIAIASLIIAEVQIPRDAEGAFYLLPARICEFSVGSLLVWLEQRRFKLPPLGRELLLALGIALMTVPAFTYTPQTRFPGLSAMIVCLGAGLTIYAGEARVLGAALGNPLMSWIGRISYSVYLVHWPLIVFFTAYWFRPPTLNEQVALVAASILLGWLQYRLIETRFRYPRPGISLSPDRFAAACGALAIIAAIPLAVLWRGDGAVSRIPNERLLLTNKQQRALENKTYCSAKDASKPADLFTCQNARGKARDLLVWGDSHAKHLVAGLSEAYPDYNVHVLYLSGCMVETGFTDAGPEPLNSASPDTCAERNKAVYAYISNLPPTTVVLSNRKATPPEKVIGRLKAIISGLKAKGHKVIVLGDYIRPERALSDCQSVPRYVISDAFIHERCIGDAEVIARELAYNDALAAAIPEFVNPNSLQCPNGRCRFIEEGKALYRDTHHLSITGSIKFLSEIKPKLPIE